MWTLSGGQRGGNRSLLLRPIGPYRFVSTRSLQGVKCGVSSTQAYKHRRLQVGECLENQAFLAEGATIGILGAQDVINVIKGLAGFVSAREKAEHISDTRTSAQ